YYTGVHPLTGEEVYVARSAEEKRQQRALLQYFLPKNRHVVSEVLISAGREDLIGTGPRTLIKPYKGTFTSLKAKKLGPAKKRP
ncbi:MAG: DUF3362 domain-containing protein, partial [bacterium]|nr:DUF3362 domain-containing protein [bacterium]